MVFPEPAAAYKETGMSVHPNSGTFAVCCEKDGRYQMICGES